MKLTTFEIKFNNSYAVVSAGESVSGVVHLELAKPMKMKRLILFFFGECETHWTERRGRTTYYYKGKENYLQHHMVLYPNPVTGGPDSGSVEHPAGRHAYPFSLTLLQSLPSSFEGKKGHIRYFVKASINRPWKFDSHVKRIFTVIHHHDLNHIPLATFPQEGQDRRQVESCCCDAGHVEVTLSINKTGFVPGEPILYEINVFNESEKPVKGISLHLMQVVTYSGTSGSFFSSRRPKFKQKTHPFTLYNDPTTSVAPTKSTQVNRATIIPSLPPSNLDGCSLITIEYRVDLEVNFGIKSVITKPIIIGTIPLSEPSFAVMPASPSALATVPTTPTAPSAPLSLDSLNVDMPPIPGTTDNDNRLPSYEEALAPPPSYSECVFGPTNIQEEGEDNTDGDVNWAPAYPYYDCTLRWNRTHAGQQMPTVASVGPDRDDDDDDD